MKIKNLVEGLNAQQRSVPQLPAQAQARKISVLGAKTDPQHPFAGYAVGADEAAEPGHKVKSPDQNDPYEKGWRAGFRHDESNPYAAGTPEHAKWQDGRDDREAQPDHYDEEVDLSEKLGALRPKLGTGRDVGKSVRNWRKQRGLSESDTQDKTDSNFFRKFSNLIAEAEQQITEVTRRDFLKASVVAAILSSTPVAKLMSNAPGKMSIVKHRGNLGKYQSSDIDSTGYDIGKKQFYITVDGKPYTVQTGIGAGFMGQDFKNSDFKSDPYLQKIAPWLDTKDEYILQIADYDIELYDQNNQKIFPVKDQQQMKEMYSSGLIDAVIGFSDVYQTDAIQQMAKVPNKPNYPVDQGDQSTDSKSARPTTGMSGLARAAGAQIGRTATKLGKATANTVLNQPARDMGRIEPTMSPIALPAPSVSPGMQIPKQKSRVAAKQDKEGVAETTSDPKFDKMLKGITGKKAVAKQQKTDTKQQSRDAFGSMFGGTSADLLKNLKIREQGMAEGEPIQELSSDALDRYKVKAKKSADELTSQGKYRQANDRTMNVMKATGKQIDNTVTNIRKALNKESVDQGVDETVSTHKGGKITKTPTGIKHQAAPGNYGGYEPEFDHLQTLDKNTTGRIERSMDIKHKREKAWQGGIELDEAVTKEDIITKLKAKLGDYLSDIGQEIRKDPDLINKLAAKPAGNQMGPPVKTITTDDGHEIQIHGNEDDGFRISIKNRQTPSQFKNLDEAVMACEMYCARRRTQALNADYVEEA